jgi:hypothetical protein
MTERAYCAGGKTITRLASERKRLASSRSSEDELASVRRNSSSFETWGPLKALSMPSMKMFSTGEVSKTRTFVVPPSLVLTGSFVLPPCGAVLFPENVEFWADVPKEPAR